MEEKGGCYCFDCPSRRQSLTTSQWNADRIMKSQAQGSSYQCSANQYQNGVNSSVRINGSSQYTSCNNTKAEVETYSQLPSPTHRVTREDRSSHQLNYMPSYTVYGPQITKTGRKRSTARKKFTIPGYQTNTVFPMPRSNVQRPQKQCFCLQNENRVNYPPSPIPDESQLCDYEYLSNRALRQSHEKGFLHPYRNENLSFRSAGDNCTHVAAQNYSVDAQTQTCHEVSLCQSSKSCFAPQTFKEDLITKACSCGEPTQEFDNTQQIKSSNVSSSEEIQDQNWTYICYSEEPCIKNYCDVSYEKCTENVPTQNYIDALPIQRITEALPIQEITEALPIQGTTEALPIQGTTEVLPMQETTEASSIQKYTQDLPCQEYDGFSFLPICNEIPVIGDNQFTSFQSMPNAMPLEDSIHNLPLESGSENAETQDWSDINSSYGFYKNHEGSSENLKQDLDPNQNLGRDCQHEQHCIDSETVPYPELNFQPHGHYDQETREVTSFSSNIYPSFDSYVNKSQTETTAFGFPVAFEEVSIVDATDEVSDKEYNEYTDPLVNNHTSQWQQNNQQSTHNSDGKEIYPVWGGFNAKQKDTIQSKEKSSSELSQTVPKIKKRPKHVLPLAMRRLFT